MADHFADFGFPDTDLARQSLDWAYEHESATLANHSVRTYLFGRAAGEAGGLRPGAAYDDELLFLACVLHDAGLTPEGDGDQRFEVDGADTAEAFLRGRGLALDRARVVWESIALHTSVGIAGRMRPEIALLHAGAGIDVTGMGAEAVPADLAERANAAFPRLDCGAELTGAITAQAVRNPAKAPLFSFPAGLLSQFHPEIAVPAWKDIAEGAWPGTA
ncbi:MULTISPECIES: HD domain-containing protein [Actinomadura]|uniref:HD domain-containing protein n=1 Tax=Actinomadura yumaensis TaxID=111807 RepID=A0ABW2CXT5_9ACTN|nr:HD domain-containing protein [Actinomadura sp. J1-007]MWK38008.1 HD domain-containing protein [Actinomadura sp. J1-007]